jgi:hypothetical protein
LVDKPEITLPSIPTTSATAPGGVKRGFRL